MTDLLAARLQMSLSLGFHIIFACIGMVMPFLMAWAHGSWLRTKEQVYLDLTKAWSKGVAIFFATGAVSGTLLSFELGLLWPTFMKHAGPIFGMPFSLEGTAFFVEAIALGLFLYGWDRLSPLLHWTMGVVVGISGVLSGILVVAANGWMNSPRGFDYHEGVFSNIDPLAAMFNDAWFHQALHMTIAAFEATGFAVAGLHALLLWRKPNLEFHKRAITIALPFACVAALLQFLSGDMLAKDVAERQPLKLAAMEAHFETMRGAPIIIGGIPDSEKGTVDYAIRIPYLLSFLAFGELDSEVKGLKDFPRELWPPVVVTHFGFQIMVGIGSFLGLISVLYLSSLAACHCKRLSSFLPVRLLWLKQDLLKRPWFLLLLGLSTPLGFIAVEAGWVVTEVGRQPWIIYNIMKTSDALTPMPGLVYSLIVYSLVYLSLSLVLVKLMSRQIRAVEKNYL